MFISGKIKKGVYFDSVTLMGIGKKISEMDGVIDAAVVMGTKENKAILAAAGLLTSQLQNSGDTDLLICVKTETEEIVKNTNDMVDELLNKVKKKVDTNEEYLPKNINGALTIMPDANLALISVAGAYAGYEAKKALERGLHVMLFSDNVPLEKEIELKKMAQKKGLLLMGPDCGTAIINGVPLGFANVVNRGSIGVVAASGTGLQEVTSIISNEGLGISQAIGTGGRDIKKDVGGIMFIEALKALTEDENTKVILLVSKPPDIAVLKRIDNLINDISKPVISLFLGTEIDGIYTLEEAALTAVSILKGKEPDEFFEKLKSRDEALKQLAKQEAQKRNSNQKYIRGLFSGGTFCTEAQIIVRKLNTIIYSNVPFATAIKLKDSLISYKHTLIDMGDDEFTSGRPHPMIDYSLRNKRILQEAKDPQTAVILLDVVLGYGSNTDPVSELSDLIQEASKKVAVICSVTGTNKDPQNRVYVEQALKNIGAIVMPSNAAACKLAVEIVQILGD